MPPSPTNASTLPVQSQPAQENTVPDCREFTMPVTVGGQEQQAVGQACRQPDGSWRITQDTPGLPPQVYTLPPQAIYTNPYPYQYYWTDPWGYGPPFFAGGAIFFSDGFHRFHHRDRDFDRFHRSFGGGFHHGFHGGIHGGGFHGGGHR